MAARTSVGLDIEKLQADIQPRLTHVLCKVSGTVFYGHVWLCMAARTSVGLDIEKLQTDIQPRLTHVLCKVSIANLWSCMAVYGCVWLCMAARIMCTKQ